MAAKSGNRRAVRSLIDFISADAIAELRQEISQRLQSLGIPEDGLDHVTVAFPNRPVPNYRNIGPRAIAEALVERLNNGGSDKRKTTWGVADGLFQVQGARRTRTGWGFVDLDAVFDRRSRFASPTAFSARDRRRFFVIVDPIVVRGDTMAEMVSYIESHERVVLALASMNSFHTLADDGFREFYFKRFPWKDKGAVERMNAMLDRVGLSVDSLTNAQISALNWEDRNLFESILSDCEKAVGACGGVPSLTDRHLSFFNEFVQHSPSAKGH